MAKTLDQWLAFLTSQMDKRAGAVTLLRDYATGNARLPEMGPNLRKSWREFQRRSRANAAAMVVDALAERIVPNGLTIGGAPDSDKTRAAARIWRDNRLDVTIVDAVYDAVTLGAGYLLISQDDTGQAVITPVPRTLPSPTSSVRSVRSARTLPLLSARISEGDWNRWIWIRREALRSSGSTEA